VLAISGPEDYSPDQICAVKIRWRVGRSIPEDSVFDLEFLSQRGATGSAVKIDRTPLATACDIVMSVRHEQFLSQVVAYLSPEYHDYSVRGKPGMPIREHVISHMEAL